MLINQRAILTLFSFALLFSVCNAEASKDLRDIVERLRAKGKWLTETTRVYGVNTLSIEALKSCLLLLGKADEMETNTEQQKTAVNRKARDIEKIEREMESLQLYLNSPSPYGEEAIRQYNLKVDKYNNMFSIYEREFSSYKALETDYNSSIDIYNRNVEQFDVMCDGKTYHPADLKKLISD